MTGRPVAIYAGYVVRCPLGGYAWQALHYLRGLRDAGFEPFFYEDTRHHWQAFDPTHRSAGDRYATCVELAGEAFARAGFADRWAFFDSLRDLWSGAGREATAAAFADAKVLINAAGVHRFAAAERAGKVNVYIDMDPAYTQIRLANGDRVLAELLAEHDLHFSFGENLGTARCSIPTGAIDWRPTRQPIALEFWPPSRVPGGAAFTTIGTWDSEGRDVELNGVRYSWRKREEWARVLELPRATGAPFRIAMEVKGAADRALLERHGWEVCDPIDVSRDPERYRDFVIASRGEFTTAKDVNVRLRSGWFSDRSACYLAAGRPVITQDTGFVDWLPVGEGLFAYRTLTDAVEAVQAISTDLERHGRAARRIAEEHFEARRVVEGLLAPL